MRLGIWTPVPHVTRDEPAMAAAVRELETFGASDGPDRAFALAAETIERAEAHGFDITLVAERLLGPDLEAWVLASALAARTSRIELMVAVHPGIATPQMVAKMGASLDRVSGGRFAVNIVNGWWQEEMDLFGNGAWLQDADARATRMGEFVEVIRALWDRDEADYAGRFYRFGNGRVPTRPRRAPPIYAASRSDSGKELIARHCDCWFVEYQPDYRRFDDTLAQVERDIADMRARAARYGRTLQYGISAHAICYDTQAEAESAADEIEAGAAEDRKGLRIANALGAGLVGTPELVVGRIRRYEAAGVDLAMLRFHPVIAGMEAFAAKAMPLLGRGGAAR